MFLKHITAFYNVLRTFSQIKHAFVFSIFMIFEFIKEAVLNLPIYYFVREPDVPNV